VKTKESYANLFWPGLALAGLLIYLGINYQVTGNFFMFVEIERTQWYQYVNPLQGLARLAMGIRRHFSRQHYSWQCANNLRRLRAVDGRHGFSASLSSLLQRIHAIYLDAQRFHGLVDKHSPLRASHVSHVHTTRASRTQKNAQLRNIGSLHGGIVLFHSAVRKGLLVFLKQFDKMRKRTHASVLWRTRANVFPINFYLELSKLESYQGKRSYETSF
jgi:hypothetical protein